MLLEEILKQEQERFIKENLLSDEMIELLKENIMPFNTLDGLLQMRHYGG